MARKVEHHNHDRGGKHTDPGIRPRMTGLQPQGEITVSLRRSHAAAAQYINTVVMAR